MGKRLTGKRPEGQSSCYHDGVITLLYTGAMSKDGGGARWKKLEVRCTQTPAIKHFQTLELSQSSQSFPEIITAV